MAENDQIVRHTTFRKNRAGWFPIKTFELLQRLVSWWAIELVITRRNNREILLTKYEGKYFRGQWHIPGGFALRNETFEETGRRTARRELGINVTFVKVINLYKWRENEHPIGRPLSVFCAYRLKGKLRETATMKYFDIRSLPKPMVPCHRRFILSKLTKK